MLPVPADHRRTDGRPPVEVTVIDLRHGNAELPVHFRDHRPDHGAFLFERAYVAEENIKFKSSDPHMASNSSVWRTEETVPTSDGPGRYAVQSSSPATGDDETVTR